MKTLLRRPPEPRAAAPAAARRRIPAPPVAAFEAAGREGWEARALVFLTVAVLSFGLMQLYSASAFLARSEGLAAHHYALRQLGGAVAGAAVALVLSRVDYRHWRRAAWPLLWVTVAMLVVLVLPFTESIAPRINGARRWLHLGISFQPSEFAKVAVIAWTAMLAVKKADRLRSLSKGLMPFLVVWGLVLALVFLQPNVSAALLIALLGALVVFAGGARIGHFILLGILAVPVLWSQIAGAGYRMRRIVAFLDPQADTEGVSYQIHQSLIAVGSGGLGGVGFGGSRQKYGFLPEPHNDFIFSMIAEEWGLLGVVFCVAVFTGFVLVGYRIAARAPDRFGYLLGIGMTNLIAVSAFLHMGVALALLPTTGVALPFVSYGRSALLTAFVAVGVLLSLDRAARVRPA